MTAQAEALERLRALNERAFNRMANYQRRSGVTLTPAQLCAMECTRVDARRAADR